MAKTAKNTTAPLSASALPEDSARFEQSLTELEALVERLEHGDLPLEESLVTFERGIHLSRSCQRTLAAAEQRVRLLFESDPVPFDAEVGTP